MKESLTEEFQELKDDVSDYLKTNIDLYKLHAVEGLSRHYSGMLFWIIFSCLIIIVLLFFAIAMGFYLGTVTGSFGLGFLLVGGFFALLAGVLFLFRHRLFEGFLIQSFIHLFFPNHEYEE
jgi:hypothetical protein